MLSTSKIREHSGCSLRDYIGVANIDILVGSGGLFQLWDGIARRTRCYPFKFKPIYPYIRFSFWITRLLAYYTDSGWWFVDKKMRRRSLPYAIYSYWLYYRRLYRVLWLPWPQVEWFLEWKIRRQFWSHAPARASFRRSWAALLRSYSRPILGCDGW